MAGGLAPSQPTCRMRQPCCLSGKTLTERLRYAPDFTPASKAGFTSSKRAKSESPSRLYSATQP